MLEVMVDMVARELAGTLSAHFAPVPTGSYEKLPRHDILIRLNLVYEHQEGCVRITPEGKDLVDHLTPEDLQSAIKAGIKEVILTPTKEE